MYVCVHIWVGVDVGGCVYICVCVCIDLCVCVCIYVWVWVYMCVRILCVCVGGGGICVCVYVCCHASQGNSLTLLEMYHCGNVSGYLFNNTDCTQNK